MSAEKADKKPTVSTKPSEVVSIGGPLERGLDQIDRKLATGVNLVLDFALCDFISVEGLEWLNLSPPIYKVFKVAHIDSLLKAAGSPGMRSGPVC